MPRVSHLQNAALGRIPTNPAWRSRTTLAGAILAVMVIGFCASTLDWSEDAAMTLGQLAGLVAPLVLLSLIGWAVVAFVSRKR